MRKELYPTLHPFPQIYQREGLLSSSSWPGAALVPAGRPCSLGLGPSRQLATGLRAPGPSQA